MLAARSARNTTTSAEAAITPISRRTIATTRPRCASCGSSPTASAPARPRWSSTVCAEQLRVASAQMVLDSRGFESAAAVGKLPEEEQHAVVTAIVQRELGVMTLAALVIVVLLARAAGTG